MSIVFRPATETLKSQLDWWLIGAVAFLLGLGTVAIMSAASPLAFYTQVLQRHLLALSAGMLAFMVGIGVHYNIYQDQHKTLYGICLGLLAAVLIFGETFRGSKSWFRFAYFSFQPTEFARIAVVLILAAYLERRKKVMDRLLPVLGAVAVIAPILALILIQPDFSSTIAFFPVFAGMVYCAGAPFRYILGMAALGGLAFSLPLAWIWISLNPAWTRGAILVDYFSRLSQFGWPAAALAASVAAALWLLWWFLGRIRVFVPAAFFFMAFFITMSGYGAGVAVHHGLRDYQRKRVVAFLKPEKDPKGGSYNIRQARIAIGAGGFWGKGIFAGTQSRLGFLPERHTDFIFAVIGEEMGFLGAIGVLLAYLFVVWRILETARLARDGFGGLVATGFAVMYGFCLIMNTGMAVGLLPVAGVPLPLVSYGGSSLVMSFWSLGIVQSIYWRRTTFV